MIATGHRFYTDTAKYPALEQLLRTRELKGSDNYYHEVLTPFQITLMSICAADPSRNRLSIYAPGAWVSLPPMPPELTDGLPGMHHQLPKLMAVIGSAPAFACRTSHSRQIPS